MYLRKSLKYVKGHFRNEIDTVTSKFITILALTSCRSFENNSN